MNNIEKKIYNWVKKKDKNIKLSQNLINTQIIDSFDLMKLIIFCEKQFNIKFKEKDLKEKSFSSVKNISKVVSKYL